MRKETSPNDPFILKDCLLGMGDFLEDVKSALEVISYHLTFKGELKSYGHLYYDGYETPVKIPNYYGSINDPVVRHCNNLSNLLIDPFLYFLKIRHNFSDKDMSAAFYDREADRYSPLMEVNFKRDGYAFVFFAYQTYLSEVCKTLYTYCCAYSLGSYKIRPEMLENLDFTRNGSFRNLNFENRDVKLLTELILEIGNQLEIVKQMEASNEFM